MATTGFWPVKCSLKAVIEYANNPDKTTGKQYLDDDLAKALEYVSSDEKTDQKMYVSGVNCSAFNAYQKMMATKRKFGKMTGNVAYHGYQSFDKGEVTPEEAHSIGVYTAKKMWGDEYEVVVTTHLNTDNIQEDICQGYFLQKIKAKNRIITATFSRFDIYFLILIYYNFFRTLGCPARSCHETTVDG